MKFKLSLLLIMLVLLASCSNKGSTTVGNPAPSTEGQKVVMSQLTSGTTTVTIALSVFGDTSDDVIGASVDVDVNQIRTISDLPAQDYFNSTQQSVVFEVNALTDGDEVAVLITENTGEKVSYEATVSSTDAAAANTINLGFISGAVTGQPMGKVESVYLITEDDSTLTIVFFDDFLTCASVPDGRPPTVNGFVIFNIPPSAGTFTTSGDGISSYLVSGTYNDTTGNYDTTSLKSAVDVSIIVNSLDLFNGSFESNFGSDGSLEGTFKSLQTCDSTLVE